MSGYLANIEVSLKAEHYNIYTVTFIRVNGGQSTTRELSAQQMQHLDKRLSMLGYNTCALYRFGGITTVYTNRGKDHNIAYRRF